MKTRRDMVCSLCFLKRFHASHQREAYFVGNLGAIRKLVLLVGEKKQKGIPGFGLCLYNTSTHCATFLSSRRDRQISGGSGPCSLPCPFAAYRKGQPAQTTLLVEQWESCVVGTPI